MPLRLQSRVEEGNFATEITEGTENPLFSSSVISVISVADSDTFFDVAILPGVD